MPVYLVFGFSCGLVAFFVWLHCVAGERKQWRSGARKAK